MKALTPKQKQTFVFIKNFIRSKQYSPSLNEIARHFKKAKTSIWERIRHLKENGYLTQEWNTKRSIQIVNNEEKEVISFVKNFNPRMFNHFKRYKELIEILKEFKNKLNT